MKLEEIHLFVSGRVQGVGFRYATSHVANQIGVGGWVKNTGDGRVEAVARGTPEQVAAFLDWCAKGPTGAQVESVEVVERTPTENGPSGFVIKR